jgi:hypothetical protein
MEPVGALKLVVQPNDCANARQPQNPRSKESCDPTHDPQGAKLLVVAKVLIAKRPRDKTRGVRSGDARRDVLAFKQHTAARAVALLVHEASVATHVQAGWGRR